MVIFHSKLLVYQAGYTVCVFYFLAASGSTYGNGERRSSRDKTGWVGPGFGAPALGRLERVKTSPYFLNHDWLVLEPPL